MLSVVVFVVTVLLVGGLLFLGASLLLGRGETQPPAELDRSPVELPADRPVSGDDVRLLRISVTARGYRMTEVDWLLEQLAGTLDERDREIAELRAKLRPADPGPTAGKPTSTAAATGSDAADAPAAPASGGQGGDPSADSSTDPSADAAARGNGASPRA